MEQKNCYFFFTGYYAAASALELLNKYRIRGRIVKAPVRNRTGCQFAIQVSAEDGDMAKYVLEREKACVNRIETI